MTPEQPAAIKPGATRPRLHAGKSDLSITVLVDDHAGNGLVAEHGLALWIEAEGKRILFDTGQGAALSPNAAALGIDLASADAIVLSHGHYDHTGGLASVLPLAVSAQVYYHPAALKQRYGRKDGNAKPVGIPEVSRQALAAVTEDRLHPVMTPMLLWSRIGITGRIIRDLQIEQDGGEFFDDPGGLRPDTLDDDMALWIDTPQGLLVFTGCGHAGLVNILQQATSESGAQRIRMVIGGFHLGNASKSQLEVTAKALAEYHPCLVVPCHCTGADAIDMLRVHLGDRVMPGIAGSGIVI